MDLTVRKNNRKVTRGRLTQKVQCILRDEKDNPILDKNKKTIPIPGKFKFIKHKIIN